MKALAPENDLLGRAPGDALFPERHSEERLKVIREAIGHFYWTALYDGEIYDVDAALASLLELLRGRGLLAETLLVVTADHGERFLDRGRLDHGYGAYDELARIPLLVRLPGAESGGRRVGEPAQIVDVAPTILDFAGIDAPALGGRSLRTAIARKRMPEHRGSCGTARNALP